MSLLTELRIWQGSMELLTSRLAEAFLLCLIHLQICRTPPAPPPFESFLIVRPSYLIPTPFASGCQPSNLSPSTKGGLAGPTVSPLAELTSDVLKCVLLPGGIENLIGVTILYQIPGAPAGGGVYVEEPRVVGHPCCLLKIVCHDSN